MDMHIKYVFYNSSSQTRGQGDGMIKKNTFINLSDVYKWWIQAIYHKEAITWEVKAIQSFILPIRNSECFNYL